VNSSLILVDFEEVAYNSYFTFFFLKGIILSLLFKH